MGNFKRNQRKSRSLRVIAKLIKYLTKITIIFSLIAMITAPNQTQLNASIGGTKNVYNWNFLDKPYQIVYETISAGKPRIVTSCF